MNFDTIVLSAGSSKGYAELGSLARFCIGEHISNVTHWIGVSIGSIISLLMLCGYNIQEIYQLDLHIFEIWLNQIKLMEVKDMKGIFKISKIREFLESLVFNKLGKRDINFQKFYELTNKKFTTVSCVLKNVRSEVRYHNMDTVPTESIVDAVIASCCIPFLIERFTIDGFIHIDGALGNAFPILYADDGSKVLGIYVESINDISTMLGYTFAIFDISKRVDYERQKKSCSNNVTIVEIVSKDINPINSIIEQKEQMYIIGWKEANSIIEKSNE